MAYLIWTITGMLVAVLVHRVIRGSIVVSMPAGVFGAFLGGIIGSGVVHADHTVTLPGALGAVIGATLFVMMSQVRSDVMSGGAGGAQPAPVR